MHGVKRQFSAPNTPQWNGFVERNNQTTKKHPELCLMKQNCHMRIEEKQYTQLSIYLIEDNLE